MSQSTEQFLFFSAKNVIYFHVILLWNHDNIHFLFCTKSCFLKHLFIYLFIFGCTGSRCCIGFSLVAVSKGYSLVAMCGLLIVMASLVAQHSLQGLWALVIVAYRLSSCNSWAPEHRLGSVAQRTKPRSPELAG